MTLAQQFDIPVTDGAVHIKRTDNHTLVDATYTERIELLPRYFYPWEFKVHVDTFIYEGK
jgi:hypothetical protein